MSDPSAEPCPYNHDRHCRRCATNQATVCLSCVDDIMDEKRPNHFRDTTKLVAGIAQAMYESRADLPGVHLVPWDKYHGRGREYWLTLARAALQAARKAGLA